MANIHSTYNMPPLPIKNHGDKIPKPILVLYLNIENIPGVRITDTKLMKEYKARLTELIDNEYHILVFPVRGQETKLEILSSENSAKILDDKESAISVHDIFKDL